MWFLGALWLMGIAKGKGKVMLEFCFNVVTWTAIIDGYMRFQRWV